MSPIDIVKIEQEARRLRAEELQRISGLMSERAALYGRLLAATLAAGLKTVGKNLRPLFSWNPQAHRHS
ncbi:MAG: hypothetical protein A3H93_17435 [Rhodocyclales bacterium RIFCSPLOWO2_02_FULL_63_24]|nr:MAG: hypothetical protein A2040_16995 [Rhodocyclales bacterium GWA2_65_19]OHC68725.1 MAG: hypothetical protein A3H93_17435 [Rhodocyclales bacterium RIFCSPLOWO2_02_FULL_63_24]